jgi:hypothetical protein
MNGSPLEWAPALKDLALSTILILVLYGGAKRWWVFGYQLTDAEKRCHDAKTECETRLAAVEHRCDEWKELALGNKEVARTAVDLAKRRSG